MGSSVLVRGDLEVLGGFVQRPWEMDTLCVRTQMTGKDEKHFFIK